MMPGSQKNVTRRVLVVASFSIIALILWNTYSFFQTFKEEERIKMRIWAAAQAELLQTTDLNRDLGQLPLEVISNNTSTPMILVSTDGSITSNNIREDKAKDTAYLRQKIEAFKNENPPIAIVYKEENLAMLYYGDPEIITKLKYYPMALLLIIFLFGAVVFLFYSASKASEQNQLWTGMAKETAHQIGTPLSSLLGWTEILKDKDTDPSIITEIEKDIERLEAITARFSKIGSVPVLQECNIVDETEKAVHYLKRRNSKRVQFVFRSDKEHISVMLNPLLYQWTIENLIKNAIDAMKGVGTLTIDIISLDKRVKIHVSDTGKGIRRRNFKRVFTPGFTTKKRGWGLGLSLVKRIVEDYHQGKIRVLSSVKDKGTVMEMAFSVVH
ncbi:MAG: HAMP domain-containing sensor histidine kinase [Bacteroidota bacterium]